MPTAVEQLDLRGYDVVLSCSHSVAKGVIIVAADAPSLLLLHAPALRLDMYHEYLNQLAEPVGAFRHSAAVNLYACVGYPEQRARGYLHCDFRHVAQRIRKYYRRDQS